ncbi:MULTISPECIES: hypothetical protein [unclassified Prevotella]|uniref:hypothetical protein n=1 Tax=unclassified Prevotella TaxID=2638335 RepID=UPI00117CB553|nr:MULTISPECIES: hypothetical protein [unclassified Prevotella]
MKIDSPSSITSREASVRLEWISTRILPGVAVLLLSIPLCQWADSNLPDGIVPVSIIYLMIVIILWSMYMAVQYAFVGMVQTRKNKDKVTMENSNPHEDDGQAPVFLLEAMPMVAESNGTESVCNAEVVEEIAEKTIATDSKVISEEANHPDNEAFTVSAASASSTYQQGIDDFYQSQAESQKKKLDTIHEYLLYIMSPFVYEEDMNEFCTDLLRFAMDHNYRPEVEWKRFKTKLSSFDVRHLVWSIAIRLGLGKGKVYSNDDCACYIERRFASLCVTASGEPLSHSTLRNLTVTSNSDQIHCDIQGADGLLFHIPSQLGIEKD